MPIAAPETATPPAYLTIPPRAWSDGDDAIGLAELGGLELDEHQRLAIDAIMSVTDARFWVALEACVVEPRQNGKSAGILMPIALAVAIFTPDQLVVWSAHRYKTARESFLAMLVLFGPEDEPTDLGRMVSKRSYSNGEEGFEFHNGSRIVFIARSGASGRGLSGDLVILDEALFLTDSMMGALLPTLSARPNPMVLYASSAGLAHSFVLQGIRDRGRAGGDPSLVYVEWCAPPSGACASKDCDHAKPAVGCMLDDPANWIAANPAVAAGRMTVTYIAAERRALSVAEFARERMGWWESSAVGGLFHMPSWWKAHDRQSQPGTTLIFGVHTTPDRSWSTVAVASVRGDRVVHGEIVARREGVAWLVPWLTDRVERHQVDGVVIAGSMAAGSLAPDLESFRGFRPLSSTEVRRACASLYDAVTAEQGFAYRPDREHSDAVQVAVQAARRSSGRGEWIFDADPDIDLSPVYAIALAAWAARSGPRQLTDDELLASAY